MLFYRNESSLDEMLFQCFLADKSANQAAHQSSSNNDYQHGNRSDIEHSLKRDGINRKPTNAAAMAIPVETVIHKRGLLKQIYDINIY